MQLPTTSSPFLVASPQLARTGAFEPRRSAPEIEAWTGGKVLLRILSNLADRRVARARAVWPLDAIGGETVRDDMI